MRDKASYVLEQGDIRFVVSGALDADSPIADHVRRHGDGVHDLAWLVDDAGAAYAAAVARGARSVREPWVEPDDARRPRARPGRRPTARRCTRSSTAGATAATPLEPGYTDRAACPTRRVGPDGRPRRASTTSSATSSRASSTTGSTSTPTCMGFAQLHALRRRPDPHRVLGADVDGRVGRLEDRDADQRAGRGPQEEPDPGVHRALRRARRAAHRPAHRRHRRRRAGAARPRRAVHDRARHLLRRGPGAPRRRSTCRGTSCSG